MCSATGVVEDISSGDMDMAFEIFNSRGGVAASAAFARDSRSGVRERLIGGGAGRSAML